MLNLQKQLDAEKRAREDGQEAEKRALARALLFEIDHFYRSYLPRALKVAQAARGKQMNSLATLAIGEPAPFDIYHANSGRLGGLGFETAVAVIRFYKIAEDLKDHVSGYGECLRRGDSICFTDIFLNAIESVSQNLKVGALEACYWLCQTADLRIGSADIAVAGELTQIKELASQRQISINLPGGFEQLAR